MFTAVCPLLPKDLLNPRAPEHFHRVIPLSTIELFFKVLKLISLVRALLGDTSKPQKNFWNDVSLSQNFYFVFPVLGVVSTAFADTYRE